MQKLSLFGQELISYKIELLKKDYPKVVHDSLVLATEKLEKDEFISSKIRACLINEDISLKDFENEILKVKNCKKTEEELLIEFDEVKKEFISYLYEDTNLVPTDISFESDVKEDKIIVKKEFIIKEDFLKTFFYISNEEDFEILMKRKGFIEKFSILRLEKIMKDFLLTLEIDTPLNFAHSSVFFNSNSKNYGILFLIDINMTDLDTEKTLPYEQKLENYSQTISEVLEKVDTFYNIKMYS